MHPNDSTFDVNLSELGNWSLDTRTHQVTADSNLAYIFGLEPEAIAEGGLQPYLDVMHAEDRERVAKTISEALANLTSYEESYRIHVRGDVRNVIARGHVELDGSGTAIRLSGLVVDVTERMLAERALALEKRIFEMIGSGSSLQECLTQMILALESQSLDGMLFSVLLLDQSERHLLRGAAPSLPEGYNNRTHGLAVGPLVGSCGKAVLTRQPVEVIDISQDPMWADFRQLAADSQLGACCSTPILASDGTVLGTLAVYYREPRAMSKRDRKLLESAKYLTGVLLQRERAENALLQNAQEYQLLASSIPQLVWRAEANGHIFWYNQRWYDYTGTTPEQSWGGDGRRFTILASCPTS